MDRNAERALSLRLSSVLDDIGVSHKMVMRRRNTFLKYEKLATFLKREQLGLRIKCHTFGSQTEGTTTMGMNSDVNEMQCQANPAILHASKWEPGLNNYLITKVPCLELPPQHCHLQLYLRERPAPVKYDNDHAKSQLNDIVVDEHHNVFLQNNYIDNVSFNNIRVAGYKADKTGPAISINKKYDYVVAVKCKEFPRECLFWKVRPRPGHWPARSVLESCTSDGVFIVPIGYPGSEHAIIEWRFSTSMVERKIMFSCNMAQIKTYVILKYLKKEFFKLSSKCIVNMNGKSKGNGSGKGIENGGGKGKENGSINGSGKGKENGSGEDKENGNGKGKEKNSGKGKEKKGRFSSYHCKTALLFTIENTPEDFWREDNLLACVRRCLQRLLSWMRKGFCPSFTIENVNLFTGKLSSNERLSMTKIIEDKLETNLQCLFEIESDEFGERLKEKSGMDACLKGNSIDFIEGDLVHFFTNNFSYMCYSYLSVMIEKSQIDFDQAGAIKFLQKRKQEMEHAESTCRPEWLYLYKLFGARLKSILTSIEVSATIDASQMPSQEHFTLDTLNAFESPSKIEFILSRLRLASLCYTNNLHEKALTYLLEVFEKIKDENECAQICSCLHAKDKYNRETRLKNPKRGFKQKIKDMDDNSILKLRPPCLQFLRFEKNCIPQFLTYEMYRTFTKLEQKTRSLHNTWMDTTMVDPVPFTYYLLFHTYHDMGKHEKTLKYLHLLLKYMKEDNFFIYGHYETTCNMIAHCFQKSGCIRQAYEWYATSLALVPENNAAKWHLCFLINELIFIGVKDLFDTPEEVKYVLWD